MLTEAGPKRRSKISKGPRREKGHVRRVILDRGTDPGGVRGLLADLRPPCRRQTGVFTALGEARQTGEPLARTLNANPRALTMLLDALCAMGLVEKAGDGYTNTEAARVWLSKDSPRYLGYMIMHYHHLVTAWSRTDKAVMTGGPVERGPIPEAEERESFLMGMLNLAMGLCPLALFPRSIWAGRRTLLDLGGGPGTYAIHFCMHNPKLMAAVYAGRPPSHLPARRFNGSGWRDASGSYQELSQGPLSKDHTMWPGFPTSSTERGWRTAGGSLRRPCRP